ncbi:hypothetical protein [Nocardioides jishulii]|uniref:hypothetical protein n=1 Tax=Nocardioides jishulii TaxID=2575440 RepID=UPI0026C86153
MSTQTESAVRYEKDADGIVTLTMDDPNASANTMNEAYARAMEAAVDRLAEEVGAEGSDVKGVDRQREEDLLRRVVTSRA